MRPRQDLRHASIIFPRAYPAATQCESTRGTAGAMGGGSADEPLPGAIQDAVAAAIEDGATMDEIVACVRAGDGDRSPSAEGRWAARIDGLICLQRETDRCAEEWVRTREPGAEGRSALVAIETLRTLALRTMAELGARGSRCRRRTSPASRSRSTASKAPTGSVSSASRRWPMPPRARRTGRARGQYDACRTGRNRPPGS